MGCVCFFFFHFFILTKKNHRQETNIGLMIVIQNHCNRVEVWLECVDYKQEMDKVIRLQTKVAHPLVRTL